MMVMMMIVMMVVMLMMIRAQYVQLIKCGG